MKYKYIDHTADIQFKAYGKTIEEVYENSAIAMFNSMCEDKIDENQIINFEVSGTDKESLMYNFLEELLFFFDTKGFVLSSIQTKVEGNKIKVIAKGDSAKNYNLSKDIKAVTYHNMFVKQEAKSLAGSSRRGQTKEKNKWVAQVVLDI